MSIPSWRDLTFLEGILVEPIEADGRLVLWLPEGQTDGFQYWERVEATGAAVVRNDKGISAIPATSIRARHQVRGLLGKWLGGSAMAVDDAATWTLPDGERATPWDEGETQVLLVWADDPSNALDEARIESCWPDNQRMRAIAANLFLVAGVALPKNTDEQIQMLSCPRAEAERLLGAARTSGDRGAESSALADLGVMFLSGGDARKAVDHFKEALVIARAIGDRPREIDVLGNLGQVSLSMGQAGQARQIFEQELTLARDSRDRFAEKIALERLGLAHAALGDPNRALTLFEEALTLARALQDRQQEANLLWQQAIQLAELGQRDRATIRAQAAIAIAEQINEPRAEAFAHHLRLYGLERPIHPARARLSARAIVGEPIDVSMAAAAPGATAVRQRPASGPGLLRMGLSAAKSLTQFLGAGFRTVNAATQQQRLRQCADCVQHTGLRCKACGCFTNVKTRLPHESCPLGKWPAAPE